MISKTAKNRGILKTYLESLSEDDFIDKIIIPLFNKNGYILYTRNTHGPGEHGKDVIFYRHVPLFYDHEFITVQAKAEKVTASNVAHFSSQLTRALRTPFPGKTNLGDKYSNYVLFMNSKGQTNDANFEFPHLLDGKGNIKLLYQDNVIEIIFSEDFIPDDIADQISNYDLEVENSNEKEIREIIFSEDITKIRYLFNTRIALEGQTYSNSLKAFLVNYIFHRWNEDRGWEGTVEPMKWLNRHFKLIQPEQSEKLFQVFEEYTNGYPSRKARMDTFEVINKITPEQLLSIEVRLIEMAARKIDNLKDFSHLINKLVILEKATSNPDIKHAVKLIFEISSLYENLETLEDKTQVATTLSHYQEKKRELQKLIFPESRRPVF